jgi:hypothetical protein
VTDTNFLDERLGRQKDMKDTGFQELVFVTDLEDCAFQDLTPSLVLCPRRIMVGLSYV